MVGDVLLRQYGATAAGRAAHRGGIGVHMFEYALPLVAPGRGSPHCCELPIVFGTFEHPYYRDKVGHGDIQRTLSHLLMQSFGAFADHGNPTTGQLPDWPTFSLEAKTTLVFGADGVPAAISSMTNAAAMSCFDGLAVQAGG